MKLTLDDLVVLRRFPMDRHSRINFVYGLIELCKENLTTEMSMVECGTAEGISTMTFAHFVREIVTIDRNRLVLPALDEFQNVRRITGDTVNEAVNFTSRSLDCVYLDSDHSFAHVTAEIEAWLPKIKSGGYIAGHDFQSDPGVEVIRAVCQRFDFPDRIYGDSSWIVKV